MLLQDQGLSREDKLVLSNILKRIGGKDTTQEGLNELFQYQQDNPGADMDYFYSRMSADFRIYVQRGLTKRAAKRAGDHFSDWPRPHPPCHMLTLSLPTLVYALC